MSPSFEPDPQQLQVLQHAGGSLLVTGPAGTGKTWVLRERFARLIEAGEDPLTIALVVGSRRAREDARAALLARLPGSFPALQIWTIHGLAFQVIRFFTGVGEAAISPGCVRVIASWTSARERGFASGLQSAGLGLGGTLTPTFIAWATIHYGWRISFYLCSAFALLTVVIWRANATDWPEQHKKVNAAELAEIHPAVRAGSDQRRLMMNAKTVPWLKMLSSLSVWGLILAYGCQGYAFYVYYNWFYFYAVKVRGLQMMQAAAWTSAPFLAMALLSPVGGWFSDRLSRRSGRRQGRIWAVWLGMGVSAVLLILGSHLSITVVALPMIALAAGFNYFATSNFWASCIDLAPEFSASLSGLMNTVGNIGGAISSTATAYLAVHQGWSRALDVAALVTVGSGLLFSAVNAGRTIEEASRSG